MKSIAICAGEFPAACLPDESVYSIVVRTRLRSGKSPREFLSGLTDQQKVRIHHQLPCFLGRLSTVGIASPNHLLYKHTLFPFFRMFWPKHRTTKLEQAMLEHSRQEVVRHALFSNNQISFPHEIKFCQYCRRQDLEENGVAYWHLSHQVFGVVACPFHHCSLVHVPLFRSGWDDLKPVPLGRFPYELVSKGDINFASFCSDMLCCISSYPEQVCINDVYHTRLKEIGAITSSGRLRRRNIVKEFDEYIRRNWRGLRPLALPHHKALFRIFHNAYSKTQHVYHHLLVSFWLFGTTKRFDDAVRRANNTKKSQLGSSKSKCKGRNSINSCSLNDMSFSHAEKVRDQVRLSRRTENRRLLLSYIAGNPHCDRKQVVRDRYACFHWLYRNDREWLYANLPPARPTKQPRKVNWKSRDAQLATQLGQASSDRPEFNSWSEVDRYFGGHGWFLKSRARLPKTTAIVRKILKVKEGW